MGGRIWTVRLDNDEIAEMGAEWVMPGDAELGSWADRYGVAMAEAGVDYIRREARGPRASSQDEQDEFLAVANAALTAIPPDGSAGLTLGTFLDALDAPGAGRDAVRMRLQGTNAVDLGQVALRVVGTGPRAFAPRAATYRRMARGNQALPDAIAASLPDVRLGHRVRALVHDRAGVRVQVEGEVELSGVAAVVALPARVASGMRFDPFLPDDLATALHELPMGVGSKLAVPVEGCAAPRAVQSAELPFWCWIANGGDGAVRRCLAAFAGSELAQESLETAAGDPGPWLKRLLRAEPRPRAVRHARAQVVGARPAWRWAPMRRGTTARGIAWSSSNAPSGGWPSPGSTPPARNITAPWRVPSVRASARRRRCSRCSADGTTFAADTMLARAHVRARAEPRRREGDPWPTPPSMNLWC